MIADLHGNFKVRFPGLSLHSIRQPKIQKTLAGGIHDELARLVPEGFLRGSDHHELTASGGAPGCKPLSMIGKPVLCEMVLSIEQLSAAEAKSPGAIFDVSSTVLDPKLETPPQTLLLVHYESILLESHTRTALGLDTFDNLDSPGEFGCHFVMFVLE